VFDEDTALGSPSVEDPNAAARYDHSDGWNPGAVLFRSGRHPLSPGHWEVGLAYSSAPLGSNGTVKLAMERSQGHTSCDGGDQRSLFRGRTQPCVSGEMRYHLPDIFTAGVTWHATAPGMRWGIVRWGSLWRI